MLHLLAASLLFSVAPPLPGRDAPPRVGHAAAGQEEDEDEDEGPRGVDPGSPIVVTARRLDAARTGVDASLGATVYALSNEAIENRPGGETGSVAAILRQ